jgi:hypothetical protein
MGLFRLEQSDEANPRPPALPKSGASLNPAPP